uniref:Putative secreted peptide n=1 Tax=Anopheles braziliensis TaxID=58242 RepID=A0A2M3ZPB6_9DIPT
MMVMMMVVVMVMMVATSWTTATTTAARQIRNTNAHRIGTAAAAGGHYLHHTIRATTIDGHHFRGLIA